MDTLFLNLQFFANDDGRTEEATPRRKQEARKKGQVPKSTELNTIVQFLIMLLLINATGKWFFMQMITYLHNTLSPKELNCSLTMENLSHIAFAHCVVFLKLFLPFGIVAMLAGILINYLQVGFLFSLEPLRPKFSRLNPVSGLKNLFSTHSLVEMIKAMGKLFVVCYFAYATIKNRILGLTQSLVETPFKAMLDVWGILFQVSLKICTFLLVLALFDYAYQRWEYRKSLRMTKKEIRDEYKQMEGDPKIKGKIRQRQRQMATRRMMQDVPKADVVITNPTHLAIALRYDPKTMAAPIVVAKGEELIAAKIREIATASGITLVENKPLAHALYKTVEIGEAIPEKLFQAVAEVLAFVYRLKRRPMTAYSR